ncbi:MAG: hypothetical protein KF905_10665 [Flavobacteriales bacterium]|nr:hypothetical protein [Flavobacteriales bacterium]
MFKHAPLLVCALLVGSTLTVRSQDPVFAGLVEDQANGQRWLLDVSAGADGKLSILERDLSEYATPYEIIVTSFSFEQGAAWQKRLISADPSIILDPMRIKRLSNGESLVLGFLGNEANYGEYFLIRLDAAGMYLGTTTFRAEDVGLDEDFDFGNSDLHELEDGSILLNMGFTFRPIHVRWQGGKSVDWARSYVTLPDTMLKQPFMGSVVLPGGDVLIAKKTPLDVFLVRADGQGDVVWARRYVGLNAKDLAPMVLGDGSLAIAGRNTDGIYVARFNADGEVIWVKFTTAELVDYEPSGGFKRMAQRSNGDLLLSHHCRAFGMPSQAGAVIIRQDGSPIQAWALQDEQMGGLGVVASIGDEAVMAGYTMLDVDGAVQRVILLTRSNITDDPFCLFGPDVLSTWDASYTITSIDAHAVEDRPVTIGSIEVEVLDMEPHVVTICSQSTDIQGGADRSGPALVINALVMQGEVIHLSLGGHMANSRIEVLDMGGRTILHALVASEGGTIVVPRSLGSGVYLVRVLGMQNELLGVGRVVVL